MSQPVVTDADASHAAAGPLTSLRVLDVASFIAAPAADITFGVLPGLRDLPGDPQMEANGVFVPTGAPAVPRTIANPLNLTGAPHVPPRRAPTLGEHSDEILREVGYADAEVARLRAAGTVV